MKVMININIFQVNIFLNKKHWKTPQNVGKWLSISTCDQKHIDGYDIMYPCGEFE